MKGNDQHPEIAELRAILFQYSSGYAKRKSELIKQISKSGGLSVQDIKSYKKCLTALMAYPDNRALLTLSQKSLTALSAYISNLPEKEKSRLMNSAIARTTVLASFSYTLTHWLVQNFPDDIELYSSDAEAETVRQFFRLVLPRVEYESISARELKLEERIKRLKRKLKISNLEWLTDTLEASGLNEQVKEILFHELKVVIKWKLNAAQLSPIIHPLHQKIFYHRAIQLNTSIKTLIRKPIPAPVQLSETEKKELINTARAFLATQCRETDPFTYADPEELTAFNLEKGGNIVLYGMTPRSRLSIESYIGYLLFKNKLPVAYGGGWIFGERCQFGINIGAAFRGAESAFLFAQLLRVYHQYFRVQRFVIKPFQFGKQNKEALQSGAFWFYYKAGFRPESEKLRKLAEAEMKKKNENNLYKSPVSVLKKFTNSNLYLNLVQHPQPLFDAAVLSKKITAFINQKFSGDRNKATKICFINTLKKPGLGKTKKLTDIQNSYLREWGLIAECFLNISVWNRAEKAAFLNLLLLKGKSPERKFILALQRHKRIWQDLTTALGIE